MSGDGYLFVGGPAHGKWIMVPNGQTVVWVPEPVRPSIWEPGDALYPTPKEHVYRRETVAIFGRFGRIMVCDDCLPTMVDLQRAMIDVLLTDDAKEVIR